MGDSQTRTRDPGRKSRIMNAAAELIGRNGYHAVSMTEIGSEAGITGSAIYRHFDSKSAILVALFDGIIDDLIADQIAVLDTPGEISTMLERLVEIQVRFVVSKRELAQVYFNEIQNLPDEDRVGLRRKQRLYLEEWVHLLRESRPALDDAHARALVHATIGVIQSPIFHNVGLVQEHLHELLTEAAQSVLRCRDLD